MLNEFVFFLLLFKNCERRRKKRCTALGATKIGFINPAHEKSTLWVTQKLILKKNLYEVWRKQQMLKIRLMGTKSDIRWFQNFLQIDSDIEVLELSDINQSSIGRENRSDRQ